MILQLKKFGTILNSRPSGAEAVLRARQIINGSLKDSDEIVIDVSDVDVLTPSFIDEFAIRLKEVYSNKTLKFIGYEKSSVTTDTLKASGLI